ncbi:5-oxoprolinase [Caballeronia mineralivorans PML1(12)]|uniref:5-oxoprolinase n=1 Tax=Caballeronia mineralivorans PML1(12) TaxID=908627 RepID=A0A0J1CMG4_9BURK|nr:hydantoinase B/oxoprolinase family protein [Caballeronia mineralivorans]KLU21912.1 5-oxoprolinase [Caballeronia mineralivorans PML1(12)]
MVENRDSIATDRDSVGKNFDAIAMEVFSNRLLAITEDMAINMMRSSFSSQIKERHDFSVGLFDGNGRLVAQGTHIPVHLGSLMGAMQALLAAFPKESIEEGDAFICNDPYLAGGTHLPDISIVSPVFVDGELAMFTACIGHHADIGGPTPGSTSATSKNIFEEGLRIPIVKIASRGKPDRHLLAMIAANSRLPEERNFDLQVQIATNERGAAAVRSLASRMKLEEMRLAIEALLKYTRLRLEQRLTQLTPGAYSFTTWLDDDGFGGDSVPIVANVTIRDNRLFVDMTGSGPQARGGLNVPRSALNATVYYCVKALVDHGLSVNSGLFEPVTITAPEGTITNPRAPAACSARTVTCQKIAGAIFGAFRGILTTDRVMASSYDVLPAISFSGYRSDGSYYVFGETVGGGSGGRAESDGMDGVHVHITNSLNMPSEALENEFPLFVEAYTLVPDSGGAGFHRGGLGICRQVRALKSDTVFSGRSDNHKRGAAGVLGGLDGGCGRLIKNFDRDTSENLNSRVAGVTLVAGETIRIETPGGAGYGPPGERDPRLIAKDVRDGILSLERAREDYGLELVATALTI